MEIRRLTPDDAAAHRDLRLRGFREHPEAFTTSHEELAAEPLAATVQRLARADFRAWGAFEKGVLCGQVAMERETRMKVRHKAHLVGMFVAPGHGGRGLGEQLVRTALDDARAQGVYLVVLTVTQGNARAVALYERCGFRSFGIEPGAIRTGGRAYGKNHMFLDLGSGDEP